MRNLSVQQRENREQNQHKITPQTKSKIKASKDNSEVGQLKKRISELEIRILSLEKENHELREQKTIIVDRTPQKSSEDIVREQRHNFFKYSSARRY